MRLIVAGLAYLSAVIGFGLLIRGVVSPACGFFAAATALSAWRLPLTPLRRIEAQVAAALSLVGAAQDHPLEGVCAAAIVVSLIELARIFR